jgi:hypothetical protein
MYFIQIIVYKPFLLVWVEMLLAEISCPCKLNQGDSNCWTQMQSVRTIEALPACFGSLSTLQKEFWNSFKIEPWYTLGTLWEHPICQAWWIMHYITLWERMFTNPRLVYQNNKTQNTKGILSQNTFFMILQCPSCMRSMRSYAIGCCHCVWSPVEANFSN